MKTTDFAVIAFVFMALTSTQEEVTTLWLTSLFVLSGCVWIFAECVNMFIRLIKYASQEISEYKDAPERD